MGRKMLLYSAGLIAMYLAVAYATGFSRAVNASAGGAANLVKAFQGR